MSGDSDEEAPDSLSTKEEKERCSGSRSGSSTMVSESFPPTAIPIIISNGRAEGKGETMRWKVVGSGRYTHFLGFQLDGGRVDLG